MLTRATLSGKPLELLMNKHLDSDTQLAAINAAEDDEWFKRLSKFFITAVEGPNGERLLLKQQVSFRTEALNIRTHLI